MIGLQRRENLFRRAPLRAQVGFDYLNTLL